MFLSDIQKELKGLVRDTWASDVQTWGERVALYRQYAAGEHRAKLTAEMRAMLRVDSALDRFNANYCNLITQAMSDRLTVTAIEGSDPAATEWAKDIQENNRFDVLQMDTHESLLIDGDTFVMAAWSEKESKVIWAHEPAYDGDVGMIPVYDRMRRKLVAAIKIWWEGNAKRVNLYLPGAIKKYTWEGNEETPPKWALKLQDTPDWTDTKGSAIGVPVVHFKNRASTYAWHGESELVNAIPLQDVLNRTITSMVMTSELSAFQIRVARGFTPPPQVQPGMWLIIGGEGLEKDTLADASVLQQAELVPFIEQSNFVIEQIGSVTMTPIPSAMGTSASSGEALKQREVGLIGKVRRAQTRFGNGWEDVVKLSSRLQDTYGTKKAPESTLWRTKWQDASPRNDGDVIANAMAVRDVVGDAEVLRLIAPVYNYDEKKIRELMSEKDEAAANALGNTGLPGFKQFGTGTDLNQTLTPAPFPTGAVEGTISNPNNAQIIDQRMLNEALMMESARA
jgi:hypothetical protein